MAQTLPTSSGVPPSVLLATLRAALERRWGPDEDSSSRYGNKAGKLRQGVDSGCKVRQNKVLLGVWSILCHPARLCREVIAAWGGLQGIGLGPI